MKSLYFSISIILIFAFNANAQNYVWAESMGGTGFDRINCTAIDDEGNLFVTGLFLGIADFDPSSASAELDAGFIMGAFLAKYDQDGNYIWAHHLGTSLSEEEGISVDVDNDGNVYVGGHIGELVFDIDPGAGSFTLTPNGNSDIFFAKFDPSGNFIWAKNIGGESGEKIYDLELDNSGNIFLSGYIQNDADMDPSAAEFVLEVPQSTDAFFAKYSNDGDFIWAHSFVGAGNGGDSAQNIDTDGDGNAYITGYFNSTVDFDGGAGSANHVSSGLQDIFIAKYNSAGVFQWANTMGGPQHDNGEAIKVTEDGHVYISGFFSQTADFDPTDEELELTVVGNVDNYFMEFDTDGNMLWVKTFGGAGQEVTLEMLQQDNGDLVLTGSFMGTCDFDPSGSDASITSVGDRDIFVATFDASGNYLWAIGMGSGGEDRAFGLVRDGDGDIYVGGFISGPADMDPSGATVNSNSNGESDAILAKYSAGGSLVKEQNSKTFINAYPNPVNDQLTIDLTALYNNITVEIYDAAGRLIVSDFFSAAQKLVIEMPEEKGIYKLAVRSGTEWLGSVSVVKN